MDVFRRPGSLISSALQPIGSVLDKLQVARLRAKLLRKPIEEIWRTPQRSTLDYLREFGFSGRMIDEFFRSFYGGIFLEDQLTTSSRIFEFTFQMFAMGSATLPARGMQAIPEQLVARLPPGSIRLRTPVEAIDGTRVIADGEVLRSRHLVLATDGGTAHRLLPSVPRPKWNSTVCFHYAAETSPIENPIISLRGDREGLVNNVCVPSVVSGNYAPAGASLVCASVLGDYDPDGALERKVRQELGDWFGGGVAEWKLLRAQRIRKALPVNPPGHRPNGAEETGFLSVCGDFTRSGSIEGAIQSGLSAADRILGRD